MVNVAILFAEGFEEIEGLTTVDILRRAGISTTIIGVEEKEITGAHQVTIKSDKTIDKLNISEIDCLVLPGGAPGFENLKNNDLVLSAIKDADQKKKIVAAICASPSVLSHAGILNQRRSTIYPGMEVEIRKGGGIYVDDIVVIDDHIITSKGPATTIPFALKIVETLIDEQTRKEIEKKLLFNEISKN